MTRMMALWWWIDRWRRSTAYTDMTLEEQGAYRNLLDEATLRGGPLPDDDRILGKACGDALSWKRVKPAVLQRFTKTEEGWRNNTLDEVIGESVRRAEKQRNYRNKHGNAHGNAQNNERDNNAPNDPRPPISHLPSPSPEPSPAPCVARAPVALAGTLPRDHVKHGWCSSRGKCVPEFLHEEFIRSVGGERQSADQRLRAFYEAREHGWPAGPIGDDPVKLWRREFAASFPSVAPIPVGRDRTGMLQDATAEFLK